MQATYPKVQCLVCRRTWVGTVGHLRGIKRAGWPLPVLCRPCALVLSRGLPMNDFHDSLANPVGTFSCH